MSISKKAPASKARAQKIDAISLLKADHRTVAGWFKDYEKTKNTSKKQKLATLICDALKVHTTIEEDIFYPAFLEMTGDKDIHHEAEVEHHGAKNLIAEIAESDPTDDYFDAKVKVLSELIRHHVKEEEQPGGMFAEARRSDMDLYVLGEQMQRRKEELRRLL
jgi:hemerythrin superfamily protein